MANRRNVWTTGIISLSLFIWAGTAQADDRGCSLAATRMAATRKCIELISNSPEQGLQFCEDLRTRCHDELVAVHMVKGHLKLHHWLEAVQEADHFLERPWPRLPQDALQRHRSQMSQIREDALNQWEREADGKADDKGRLSEYQEISKVRPTPSLQLKIAQTYMNLGDCETARQEAKRALKMPGVSVEEKEAIDRLLTDPDKCGPALFVTRGPDPHPNPREVNPLYKRWWLWTLVGVVVAGGGAVAVGLACRDGHCAPAPTCTGGVDPCIQPAAMSQGIHIVF